ncbi:MAG: acetaldehyde dehydrogenase, partial [Melioribacteraceae bacterium]|nr:acetaldehyde dehydrogenase [Melioribacteraceae bacterium]
KSYVIYEAKKLDCYFVNEDEKKKLESVVIKDRRINPAIVGKAAPIIADLAGFSVPSDTKVLIAECTQVGRVEPLSMEKLSPILAFYTVDGWLEGCHKCINLLEFGGIGHTMVIHSNDKEVIMKFALEKPAFRIVDNTPSSLGAVGFTTALTPSMTLGVGTWGGSIISENVSAKHLMNIKTLAFETAPMNPGSSISSYNGDLSSYHPKSTTGFLGEIEDRLLARAGNPTYAPIKLDRAKPANDKEKAYGTGISKDDIEKIIREFKS